MIFVTLGSQKFQFNRLLKELDKLVEEGVIDEEVFAQIGYSDYVPRNYEFKKFLDREEFSKIMEQCDKVITHGGTGAIIGAVKKKKKVMAIPRSKEFNEHVDNHQYDIVNEFAEMNFIVGIYNLNYIGKTIIEIENRKFNSYKSNTNNIILDLEKFIKNK